MSYTLKKTRTMYCDICGQSVVQHGEGDERLPYPEDWKQFGGGGRTTMDMLYTVDIDVCGGCRNEPLYRLDAAVHRKLDEMSTTVTGEDLFDEAAAAWTGNQK